MDQISQSNLTEKKLVECSSNKVSLETELSETLYNTMKDFVLSNPTWDQYKLCLLYTSPSPRDRTRSRMPSSA